MRPTPRKPPVQRLLDYLNAGNQSPSATVIVFDPPKRAAEAIERDPDFIAAPAECDPKPS